jgi:cytochrome c-type biogenesis protein CcmH
MSERLRNLVTIGVIAVLAVVLGTLVATAPSATDRVEAIGGRIKCPVCQGESIANSPSPMARDMMDLVAERVADGSTDEAIIDELLASYSGAVLLDPPVGGATLPLWLAPLFAVSAGVIVIVWWRRHPRPETSETTPAPEGGRRLAPLLLLGVAFAAVVVVAGFFLQERGDTTSGVADLAGQDLDDVSNETMEAVIEANAEHPQVDGMRLALAERYFEAGDYQSAFPHYLAVAESANSTDDQAVTALIRLGWMAWDGNAETEAALGLFDQALDIDPVSTTALYLKGQVLWCGLGDGDAAADLFTEVLDDPELPAESRATVNADLEAITAGRACA